jgi:hypothetical protein
MEKHYGKAAKKRAKKAAQLTYSLGEAWKVGIGSKPNAALSMHMKSVMYWEQLIAKHGGPEGAARRIKQINTKVDDLERERDDLIAARKWQWRKEGRSV